MPAGLDWVALLRECWKTPEHAEAVAAFIGKRPPRFR